MSPRRPSHPRHRRVALAVGAVVAVIAVYTLVIAPNDVVVERTTWKMAVARPLVVAHLSDLHLRGFGAREKKAITLVDAARPDVIVVSGDVVDEGDLEKARPFFEGLHAPLGVLVVRGNWEHWQATHGEDAFYESVGATLLVNRGIAIRDDVFVAGVDDATAGEPDLGAALVGRPLGGFTLAIFHSPEYFDTRASTRVHGAFAGHTHGGQVRLPGLAPFFLPPGSGRFVAGDYEALEPPAPGAPRAKMHVSRGLGTSMLPIRSFCQPEVAIVTIVPP